MLYTDYAEARKDAQAKADRTGCHVRLKTVKVYGRPCFRVRLVPNPGKQFGCDLEGELITPNPEGS